MKKPTLIGISILSIFIILSNPVIPSAQKSNVKVNSTLDEPPTVEILEPENNTVFYSPYFEISVKFTDDIELKEVEVKYGGFYNGYTYRSGLHSSGFLDDLYFINLSVRRILPGEIYIEAKALDNNLTRFSSSSFDIQLRYITWVCDIIVCLYILYCKHDM